MPTNSTWCVMTGDILKVLPARQGHFLLESGYHTDLWFTLDALFVAPRELAPLMTMPAGRLAPYGASAVCGPLLGGAFLAKAVAAALGVDFFFTERVATPRAAGLFTAEYRLPAELQRRMGGHRVAICRRCNQRRLIGARQLCRRQAARNAVVRYSPALARRLGPQSRVLRSVFQVDDRVVPQQLEQPVLR